uniref:hypothetical protein n=1 Tax=Vibrio cholerae TaxID=666 RepID=UPI001124D902
LSKDIEMARKRLDRVLVPDDVKARYIANLNRLQELALGQNGLLATMRKAQVKVKIKPKSAPPFIWITICSLAVG